MIYAREFNKADRAKVLDLIAEISAAGDNFEGLGIKEAAEDYDTFLDKLELSKNPDTTRPGLSPQTTFGIFDDEDLVGGVSIRHDITKGTLRQHGGNIGYLIRPSARRKGYGTKALALALEKSKELGLNEVMVSCRDNNIASEKIIRKNGGVYEEGDYYDPESQHYFKRFWIKL